MTSLPELHDRLDKLNAELDQAQDKMKLKDALHKENVTLRELKARHKLLTEQLKRDVKDPKGIGDLETTFRRWINRMDFDT